MPAVSSSGNEHIITAAGAARVDGSASTQPVSGTVTANAGTNLNTSTLALDATLTGGTQKAKLVDTGGTNVASVSAAGALKVDGSAVTQPVSLSGTLTTFDGAAPTSANVLSGTVTTNGGTLITIPINRAWRGWITVSSMNNAAATGTPSVTVQSAGVSVPASATVLIQTVTAGLTTGVSANSAMTYAVVYAPTATNTATLQLNLNSAVSATASANGWLI